LIIWRGRGALSIVFKVSGFRPKFFQFMLMLCGAWLVISAVWCFIGQLQFEQKMREIRRFQPALPVASFDRRGPLGGPWDARR